MTEEEILEGNKLCAGFMEVIYDYEEGVHDKVMGGTYNFTDKGKHIASCMAQDLKYHSEWNWVMGVVEKIEGINKYEFSIRSVFDGDTKWNECKISNGELLFLRKLEIEPKIEVTFLCVVQFIKWYNENKK